MPYTLPEKIVFLHLDTPNPHNRSICFIDTIITDGTGNVVDEFSSLVNPKDEFWHGNISYHGISPEDVENAPTLEMLWNEKLQDIFKDARLVVRNPTFSMHVLAKALSEYGICPLPIRVASAPSKEDDKSIWVYAKDQSYVFDNPADFAEVERCRRSFFLRRGWRSYAEVKTEEQDHIFWENFDFEERRFLMFSDRRQCWF